MIYEKIQNVVALYKLDDSIRRTLEKAADDGNDLCKYAIDGMDRFQLSLINICLKEKLDVTQLNNIQLSYEQMNELLSGMQKGVDVSSFNDVTLTPIEMYAATVAKLTSKNTKKYFLEDFNDDQLYEILVGIENGLDVSSYSDVSITANDMESKRRQLEFEAGINQNSLQKLDTF